MTQIKAKDRLLETAAQLFQIQGYHATGLNQIVKESGAPKGSLYYHFPGGKEELALESIRLTQAFVLKNIKDGLNSSSHAATAIRNLIMGLAERFEKESFKQGIPIASLALESSMISEEVERECQLAYKSFQEVFKQKLIEDDYEDMRADELSVVINTMIEGAFLVSYAMNNTEPLRLVARQVSAVLK